MATGDIEMSFRASDYAIMTAIFVVIVWMGWACNARISEKEDRSQDTSLVICGEVVDTALGYIDNRSMRNRYVYNGPDGKQRIVPITCTIKELEYR